MNFIDLLNLVAASATFGMECEQQWPTHRNMADDLSERLLTEGILKHYSEIKQNIDHLMGLKYDTLEN